MNYKHRCGARINAVVTQFNPDDTTGDTVVAEYQCLLTAGHKKKHVMKNPNGTIFRCDTHWPPDVILESHDKRL